MSLTTTSDGISLDDWTLVQRLALDKANLVFSDAPEKDIEAKGFEVLDMLDKLEKKYGRRPSIVATRADHVPCEEKKKALLIEAYNLAKASDDSKNIVLVLESLTEYYLEDEHLEKEEAERWLRELQCMIHKYDHQEENSYCRQLLENFIRRFSTEISR